MKFDICLMNPPYAGSTHLKFLEKVIKISNVIINISPIRWLIDPFAQQKRSMLKKYKDIAEHIEDIDRLSVKDSKFDMKGYSDLGIYKLSSKKTGFDHNNFWKQTKTDIQVSIINKCCYSDDKHLDDVIQNSRYDDGIIVPISLIAGGRGCLPTYKIYDVINNGNINSIDFIEYWNNDVKHKAFKRNKEDKLLCIKFDTIEAAKNFYNSYNDFLPLKGLCKLTVQQQNIQDFVLPFFDDYSKPITEEWFKDHFKLTDAEMNELIRIGKLKYNEQI